MDNVKHNWCVFYTFPRAEKVVSNELQHRHYEVFLPLTKTLHSWKNRQKKIVFSVLFPNYIFVNTTESEIYNILQVPKICACIKCGNEPCIISNTDIEGIELIIKIGREVFVEQQDLSKGQNVRIIRGLLSGYQGVLTDRKGKKGLECI